MAVTQDDPALENEAAVQPTGVLPASRPATVQWFVRAFDSLAVRDFRLLWLGMVMTMGGMQMQMVARGILAYEITDSRQLTGLIGIGFAPSMLLFSLFGGVVGERMERRSIIQVSQFLSALMTAAIGILIVTGALHWAHLLTVSVLQGAMFAFQMPARQAAIPALVGQDRVSNAVSLNAMAMSLMTVVSPGIAGLIYGLQGPEAVYFVITGMNLVAVLFTSMIPKMFPEPERVRQSMVRNIRAGFAYIKSKPLLQVLIVHGIIVALLSMPFRMLIAVFGEDVYGATPSQIGFLLVASGIGGLVGSVGIASLRSGHRRGWVLLSAAIVSGASLTLIATVPVYWVGIAAMIGIGLGESGRWALGQSLVMEHADNEYRSRVMSVMMMTFGLMPLGIYPLSLAMDLVGGEAATLGMAVMLLVAGVLFIVTQPRLRNLA